MKNGITYIGNHEPVSVMQNGKQIAGAIEEASGKEFTAPYNAPIPRVAVRGAGKQEQLTGKNLIPYPYFSPDYDQLGISYKTQSDGRIVANGYATGFSQLILMRKIMPPGIYWAQAIGKTENASIVIAARETGGKWEDHGIMNPYHPYSAKVDLSTYAEQVEVQISLKPFTQNGTKFMDFNGYVQLEKGSVPTSYEPYCGGIPAPNPEYPIEPEFLEGASITECGKNLFDGNFKGGYISGGKVEVFENKPGSFFLAVTPCKANARYAVSKSYATERFICGYTSEFPYTGCPVFGAVAEYEATSIVVKTGTDAKYIVAFVYNSTIDTKPIPLVQVEESPVPTPYEPYISGGTAQFPILRALPDGSVRDEIDVRTGTVTRQIWEAIFDGSKDEYLYLYSTPNGVNCFEVKLPFPANVDTTSWEDDGYTNQFVLVPFAWANGKIGQSAFNSQWFFFCVDSQTGIEQMRQKMESSPIKLWYPLATPVIEHYDPQLLRQHPGYNQLILSGNLPAEVENTHYQNMKEE